MIRYPVNARRHDQTDIEFSGQLFETTKETVSMNLLGKIEVVNISDVGLKRAHNEDSTITDASKGMFILADGMGGRKAGEIASAFAATEIHSRIVKELKKINLGQVDKKTGFTKGSLLIRRAITRANARIFAVAKADLQYQGMGTTMVVGLLHNNMTSIAYVGDSRFYLFRNNQLQLITCDHSLFQEITDRGLYSPEEIAARVPKNLVTRALGIKAGVDVDIIEQPMLPGDICLLCSDGLNDMVNDEEIHLTISKYSANLIKTAKELVRLANSHGGVDNISIILVRIREDFAEEEPVGLIKRFKSRFL